MALEARVLHVLERSALGEEMVDSVSLLVELLAGPGTGKSTTAALVFGKLKQQGVNAELAHEYAKDLTWEEAFDKRSFQPYVVAKQMWRIERLWGKVDVIVTDTSTLLSLIYGRSEHGATSLFKKWVEEDWRSRQPLTMFLHRDPNRPYSRIGRDQSEDEAMQIDTEILGLLEQTGVHVPAFRVDKENDSHVDAIVSRIFAELELRNMGVK